VAQYREKIKKFAEIGANLCAFGVSIAIIWNVFGGLAIALGCPFPIIPVATLENMQKILDDVNKPSPLEGLKEYLESGLNLNQLKEFEKFIRELEKKGKMCHWLTLFDKDRLRKTIGVLHSKNMC
jgi:hypothetical protein